MLHHIVVLEVINNRDNHHSAALDKINVAPNLVEGITAVINVNAVVTDPHVLVGIGIESFEGMPKVGEGSSHHDVDHLHIIKHGPIGKFGKENVSMGDAIAKKGVDNLHIAIPVDVNGA